MDIDRDDQNMYVEEVESNDEKHDVAIIDPQPLSKPIDGEVGGEPEKVRADNFEQMSKVTLQDPYADLEVIEQKHHTWEVSNWRSLEKKTHGPIFECGGHPWRILLFPSGNGVECVSLYLEHGFTEDNKPPERWYACVQFALVLWNPREPTNYASHMANHRFTMEEGDWGFTRFVELRRSFTVADGNKRPMIEDGSANITAYVRVYKDPTGVLWHNFINYNSKLETGFVGLKNQGATCYLNSLLQSLYFTAEFRRAVYQIPTEDEEPTNSALALQRLFYQLHTSGDAVGTNELTRSFGWETKDIFEQQDVQELNRKLMESLEEKMKGTEAEHALANMFVGKTKTYVSCINVNYESSRVEDFWDIQLNVRNFKNLDESFKDYIAPETLEGENKYFAEGHGLQDAKKGVIFESFPEILHLHLKRFEYDINRDCMMKVNDRYEFPLEFDAAPYLSEDADKAESYKYSLHGVLVHSGDFNAGHYYAYLKPTKDGDWFKFDDDRVTRATLREVLEENFGGEYNHPNGNRNPRAAPIKRSMSAYMLVYLRQSRLDKILPEITESETPVHLKARFEKERAERELRRKEKEEQHLYLMARLIDNSNFQCHEGFDLAPWDEKDRTSGASPQTYKVLRAEKFAKFVEQIASDLQVPTDSIRLWSMVNRQNKTVRPDQPIIDTNLTIEEASIKYGSKGAEFRLWIERMPTGAECSSRPWMVPPPVNGTHFLIFLKLFDIENQTLKGITHVYVKRNDKVGDLANVIMAEMGWSQGTGLKLYEEIKSSMIEPMKPKQTFIQAEIQDGDIVCFQKQLTDKEVTALEQMDSPYFCDAKDFYDHMVNRVQVRFLPLPRTEGKQFDLILNKRMNYEQIAREVGNYLQVPATHLRFTTVNHNNGSPKTTIKRNSPQILSQILQPSYINQITTSGLFYEVLSLPLVELETKKIVKVKWLPEGINTVENHDLLISKNGQVGDILQELKMKLNLSSEGPRIRLFEGHSGKFLKFLSNDFGVLSITDYVDVFAEREPEDELNMEEGDRCITAFHFHREPIKVHLSGVPFVFVVKQGEIFKQTKERLQKRTGIKGKPFEKIKFAVVKKSQYSKPVYLEDDDILSDTITEEGDCLGLDHLDKSKGNIWRNEGGVFIK